LTDAVGGGESALRAGLAREETAEKSADEAYGQLLKREREILGLKKAR
jgi:hypothetical protein